MINISMPRKKEEEAEDIIINALMITNKPKISNTMTMVITRSKAGERKITHTKGVSTRTSNTMTTKVLGLSKERRNLKRRMVAIDLRQVVIRVPEGKIRRQLMPHLVLML